MCLVLALEAGHCPNTQDQAGRLMAATGHLFEDVTASYHPPGVAGKAAGKIIQHPVGLPSSVFITVGDPDTPWLPHFQDCSTATLWKNASSPFPAYTDVLIELFSLLLLIAGIITYTLEWAVQAGHRLSIVRLEHHRSEIGGVWTGVHRRGIRPEGGRTGAALGWHIATAALPCPCYTSPLLGHVQRLSDLFNTESGADKWVVSPCSCTAREEQTFTMFDVTLAHCSIDDSEGLPFGRDHGSGTSRSAPSRPM